MAVLCLIAVVFGAVFAGDTFIEHRRHARAIARWRSKELTAQVVTGIGSGRNSSTARVTRGPLGVRIMRLVR